MPSDFEDEFFRTIGTPSSLPREPLVSGFSIEKMPWPVSAHRVADIVTDLLAHEAAHYVLPCIKVSYDRPGKTQSLRMIFAQSLRVTFADHIVTKALEREYAEKNILLNPKHTRITYAAPLPPQN